MLPNIAELFVSTQTQGYSLSGHDLPHAAAHFFSRMPQISDATHQNSSHADESSLESPDAFHQKMASWFEIHQGKPKRIVVPM
jgi:hypothetical protein